MKSTIKIVSFLILSGLLFSPSFARAQSHSRANLVPGISFVNRKIFEESRNKKWELATEKERSDFFKQVGRENRRRARDEGRLQRQKSREERALNRTKRKVVRAAKPPPSPYPKPQLGKYLKEKLQKKRRTR